MNNVSLVGRWTKKPELRYTQSGTAVASTNIAVNRPFAKQGQQDVDFIPVVIWGKSAEAAAEHTDKGTLVSVNGAIQVRKYQANDGTDRWATEVVANSVQFLSKANQNSGGQNNQGNSNDPFASNSQPIDISDDDLPF